MSESEDRNVLTVTHVELSQDDEGKTIKTTVTEVRDLTANEVKTQQRANQKFAEARAALYLDTGRGVLLADVGERCKFMRTIQHPIVVCGDEAPYVCAALADARLCERHRHHDKLVRPESGVALVECCQVVKV